MSDFAKHLKQLAPIAEAIVYIAERSAEIDNIEETLFQSKQDLEAAEARLVEINTLCDKAKAGAGQAKAQVIEAQSRIEQMVEGARTEIKRMQNQSKINLEDELQNVRIKFRSEEIKLQEGITALKKEKQALEVAVEARRKDHNAVQASIDSLTRRLQGAA